MVNDYLNPDYQSLYMYAHRFALEVGQYKNIHKQSNIYFHRQRREFLFANPQSISISLEKYNCEE